MAISLKPKTVGLRSKLARTSAGKAAAKAAAKWRAANPGKAAAKKRAMKLYYQKNKTKLAKVAAIRRAIKKKLGNAVFKR